MNAIDHKTAPRRLRVLICDDQEDYRRAIRNFLECLAVVETVGEAENGMQAVEMAKALEPELIIMDIAMPELNGIDATNRIFAILPDTKVLGLSLYSNKFIIEKFLNAGGSGFILKEMLYDDLEPAIQSLFEGKSFLSPRIAL